MNSRMALFIIFSWAFILNAQRVSVKNNASPTYKKGYYNWKVYLVAHADSLNSIKEVVYTLHPTFKYPIQTIKADSRNKNFAYSASGWGEFDIKVKIIYKNTRRTPLYLIHHLDFKNRRS